MSNNHTLENNGKYDKDTSLANKISDIENTNALSQLPDDLKEIYFEVQKNCEDFRKNVFLKNLDIIEDSWVIILYNLFLYSKIGDGNSISNTKTKQQKEKEYKEKLNVVKSPQKMLEYFSEVASHHNK